MIVLSLWSQNFYSTCHWCTSVEVYVNHCSLYASRNSSCIHWGFLFPSATSGTYSMFSLQEWGTFTREIQVRAQRSLERVTLAIMTLSTMTFSIAIKYVTLSISYSDWCTYCRYADGHCADGHYADGHVECCYQAHCVECCYAECCGFYKWPCRHSVFKVNPGADIVKLLRS
jgi:hypothetical protein